MKNIEPDTIVQLIANASVIVGIVFLPHERHQNSQFLAVVARQNSEEFVQ